MSAVAWGQRARRFVSGLALVVVAAGGASAYAAERESPYEKAKDAVVRKLSPSKGSHVLTVGVGVSFAQEYTRDLLFGLSYRYHFTEYIGAGVSVLGGLPFESGLVGDVRTANPAALNQIRPEVGQLAFTADFHLVPIYGKFVLFGKYVAHYGVTFSVGVGGVLAQGKKLDGQTVAERGSDFKVSPYWGVGLRILFSRSVGLAVDLRDYLWSERIATNPGDQSSWGNHFALTIGPAFRF